jgi:hypothetical protein
MKRSKPLLVLTTASLASLYSLFVSSGGGGVASKVARASVAVVTGLLAVAISLSSGGIERDRSRYEFFSKPETTQVVNEKQIS